MGETFETIDLYRKMADEGNLPLRLYVCVQEPSEAMAGKLAAYRLIGHGNHYLTVRAIGEKVLDGALGVHGGWLLEPYADDLLPGALDGYSLPEGDGSARNRRNLRKAAALLEEAGWSVKGGALTNAEGDPFAFSILMRQGDTDMQTVIEIYARALERLGISAVAEKVDNAQYAGRIAELDFDMTPFRRALSLSPGNEQLEFFGSKAADIPGSRNYGGIKDPAVDKLIKRVIFHKDRDDLIAATMALDRVLIWNEYILPGWTLMFDRTARWDRFGRPETLPKYAEPAFPSIWWWDEARAAKVKA